MPSPFPGMDPFLEDPALWPDFHDALAGEIRAALNGALPDDLYAQLGVREEVGIVDEGRIRRIVPDVAVRGPELERGAGAVAVAEPRADVAPFVEVQIGSDPREVNFVEIRDARGEHAVITVIEILSPTNKRPGKDRDLYLRKREEVIDSRTSLVEIDLLRDGDRTFSGSMLLARLADFDADPEYLALVNRAWQRVPDMSLQLFPAYLRQPLPVIAVPLREGEPETTLDLQYVFHQTYDRGPYRRGAVDYDRDLGLDDDLRTWTRERVDGWRRR